MQIQGIKGTDISGEITAEGKCTITLLTSLKTAEKLLNEVKKEKEYNVEIKQYRKKRSLDANAYYWNLVEEIARLMNSSKFEIHNQQLAKYGVAQRDENGNMEYSLEKDSDQYLTYEHNHLYPTEVTEDRNGVIYRWFIKIKGSSEYDTREMAHLIDGTVEDAKELDIETLPPDEIEKMKAAWGERVKN